MPFSQILFDVDAAGIALITINRPTKLNALNREVLDELESAFDRVATDANARAAIITGAGDKAFVAGAVISGRAGRAAIGAEGSLRTRASTLPRRGGLGE